MKRDFERRLTTIVAADVARYSQLTALDEEGTLAALRAHRVELIEPKIIEYKGRIANTAGDSLLIEFPSVVDAIRCALEIQQAMAERNQATLEQQRIEFRIGINVGDVVEQNGDLLGDGVNVAARLEALAQPGGICISHTARDQVRDRLDIHFEDLGEVKVKNIPRPIRAFQAAIDGGRVSVKSASSTNRKRFHQGIGALAALLIVSGLGLWLWQPWAAQVEPTVPADLTLPAQGKPSIAVLPFDNLSGDPDQVYFADGITEDIITDLSKVSNLVVIARASTFVYRGQQVTVRQVSKELGVSHVLEGSVQRAGSRIRVTAQLIDAATSAHIWADRYDRELKDVFALQDELTQKIVAALAVRLTSEEETRLSRKEGTSPEAYDTLLRGLELLRRFTPTTIMQGRELFEKAIALDPEYARAYANVAFAIAIGVFSGFSDDPSGDLATALRFGKKGLALDAEVPQVHFSLSLIYWQQEKIEKSLVSAYKALEIDPNYADGFAQLAAVLLYVGRHKEGLDSINKAMRLNPRHPFFYLAINGRARFALGDYVAATVAFEKALERNPDFTVARRELAASYAHLGRIEDAKWEIEEILTLQPQFSLSLERRRVVFQKGADMDRYIDGLRKAGLGG